MSLLWSEKNLAKNKNKNLSVCYTENREKRLNPSMRKTTLDIKNPSPFSGAGRQSTGGTDQLGRFDEDTTTTKLTGQR
jgi:hypothetical protein